MNVPCTPLEGSAAGCLSLRGSVSVVSGLSRLDVSQPVLALWISF
jgi:hypothetical protein